MGKQLNLIYSDRFKDHDTGVHVESAKRMDAIVGALRKSLPVEKVRWIEPRAATREELQLVHTEKHIEKIKVLAASSGGMTDPDTVVSQASFEVACLAAGAMLGALDAIISGGAKHAFAIIRPPGHHAFPEKATGFCIFNNIAIAARYAQQKHKLKKILILDWDVHHGNGTQAIFYEDDTVFYISTHQYPHYPGTGAANERGRGKGEGFTLNLPFPAQTPPEKIVDAVTQALEETIPKFQPDLFLISAGFDSHKDDPLGDWLLEDEHFTQLTKLVEKHAEQTAGGKIISSLEGGYNLTTLASSCLAHCRALIDEK